MSSDAISPSNLAPLSCSARLSASSSKARGSRPAAISCGRSVISPTPTMTGMRSSDCAGLAIVLVVTFSISTGLILRSGRLAASPRMMFLASSWFETAQLRLLTMRDHVLLGHQIIETLHRLNKIFLEFLHHGARGFHAVDQAYPLSDE